MRLKTFIGLSDKTLVKSLLADAGFVARGKKNGLACWIERKCNSPFAVSRAKTQFFHIGVAGAVQGVSAGPSQLRTESL